MIREQITELGILLLQLNGRKEYRKLLEIFKNIAKGNQVLRNLKDMQDHLMKFSPATIQESSTRSELLSQIRTLSERLKSHKENV